jgi:hypothetical protein
MTCSFVLGYQRFRGPLLPQSSGWIHYTESKPRTRTAATKIPARRQVTTTYVFIAQLSSPAEDIATFHFSPCRCYERWIQCCQLFKYNEDQHHVDTYKRCYVHLPIAWVVQLPNNSQDFYEILHVKPNLLNYLLHGAVFLEKQSLG